SFFVAYGFLVVLKREWELEMIKQLTLVILFCGILFSSISFANRVAVLGPSPEMVDTLSWMRTHVRDEGKMVFTYYSNGFWVETLAEKRTYMDPLFAFNPYNISRRYETSEQVFRSRKLDYTQSLLTQENIGYLVFDRSQNFIKEEDTGLFFLLRNNKTFKKLYSNHSVEVWEVLQEGEGLGT
ncbi:hypothetical protein COY95_04340, partial [Candidatus Woesearchaeota archaeon CG_4_10_14_0_8_um_filter_47_5]